MNVKLVKKKRRKDVKNRKYLHQFSLMTFRRPVFSLILKFYKKVYKFKYSSFKNVYYHRSVSISTRFLFSGIKLAYFDRFLIMRINNFLSCMKIRHYNVLNKAISKIRSKRFIRRVINSHKKLLEIRKKALFLKKFKEDKARLQDFQLSYLLKKTGKTLKKPEQVYFAFNPLLKSIRFNKKNLPFFGNFLPFFYMKHAIYFNWCKTLLNNRMYESNYLTTGVDQRYLFHKYYTLLKDMIKNHRRFLLLNGLLKFGKVNNVTISSFFVYRNDIIKKYMSFSPKLVFLLRSNLKIKSKYIKIYFKLAKKKNAKIILYRVFKKLRKQVYEIGLYGDNTFYNLSYRRYKKLQDILPTLRSSVKFVYNFFIIKYIHLFINFYSFQLRHFIYFNSKKNNKIRFPFHYLFFIKQKLLFYKIPYLFSFLKRFIKKRIFFLTKKKKYTSKLDKLHYKDYIISKVMFFKTRFLHRFLYLNLHSKIIRNKNFSGQDIYKKWLFFQTKLDHEKTRLISNAFSLGMHISPYQFPIKMVRSREKRRLPFYTLMHKTQVYQYYIKPYWYKFFKKEIVDPIQYFFLYKFYKYYKKVYKRLKYYLRIRRKDFLFLKKIKREREFYITVPVASVSLRKTKLAFAYFSLTGFYTKVKKDLFLKSLARFVKRSKKNIFLALYNSMHSLIKLRNRMMEVNRFKITDISYSLAAKDIRFSPFTSIVHLYNYSKRIALLYNKNVTRTRVGFKRPFRIYILRLKILLYNRYKAMYDKIRFFKKFYIGMSQYLILFARTSNKYPAFIYKTFYAAVGKMYPFLSKNFSLSLTIAGMTRPESSLISRKFYNTDFRLRARLFKLSKKLEMRFKKLKADKVLSKDNIKPNDLTRRIFRLVSTTPFFRSYLRPHFYFVGFSYIRKYDMKRNVQNSFLFYRRRRSFRKRKSFFKEWKKTRFYKDKTNFVSPTVLLKKKYMKPINNLFTFVNLFNGRRIFEDLKRIRRMDYHNKKTFYNNVFGLKVTRKNIKVKRVFRYVRIIIKQSLSNLFITVIKNYSGKVLLKGSCGIFGDRGPRKFNVFVARRVAVKIGYMLSKMKRIKNALVIIKASVFDKKVQAVLHALGQYIRFIAILKLTTLAHNGVRKRKLRRK